MSIQDSHPVHLFSFAQMRLRAQALKSNSAKTTRCPELVYQITVFDFVFSS